jgi:hypothetical protein
MDDMSLKRLGALIGASALMAALMFMAMAGFGSGTQTALAAKQVSVKQATLSDPACNPSSPNEWHFVINQIDTAAHAPGSIQVTWSDSSITTVNLQKFTGGVAHYSAPVVSGVYPTNATAAIYDAWRGQFNLSHGPCVVLDVSKTAATSYDRTYAWTIDKDVDSNSLTIVQGQNSVTANYSVTVDADAGTDSNWTVSGTITIDNPGPIAATITGVSDSLATPDCGVTFPHTLAVGDTLECTYSAPVSGPDAGTNVATVTVSQSGAGPFTGSADYTFGAPTTLFDECVDVTDTNVVGSLGTVCVPNDPQTFTYSRTFTRADVGGGTCDVPSDFDNTATFTTNDSGTTGSGSETVTVIAECEELGTGAWCSPGFWLNNADKHDASAWPAGTSPSDSYNDTVFAGGYGPEASGDPTLLQVLQDPGDYFSPQDRGDAFNGVGDYLSALAGLDGTAADHADPENCPFSQTGN